MLLKEVAPADLTPVLEEFAAHLRLGFGFADDGAEDALLARYLRAAIAAIEAETGQALMAREFVLRVHGWDRQGHLVLPIGPVEEIEEIWFQKGSDSVSVDPARWTLMPGKSRQRLAGAGGMSLPIVPRGAEVAIIFTAGHGTDWDDVPSELRQAVLMLAALYFEHRHGDAPVEMPLSVVALLRPYRPMRI